MKMMIFLIGQESICMLIAVENNHDYFIIIFRCLLDSEIEETNIYSFFSIYRVLETCTV